MTRHCLRLLTLLVLLAVLPRFAAAASPRVLPADRLPGDKRLGPLVDLNGYFPFTPPKAPAEWTARSERVRRQILVAEGLWPMPTATPAHAQVFGKVDRGEYTVEKVILESFPGHYVTGNLYRPTGNSPRRPGVLCPHGHWDQGRFYDAGETEVRKSIAAGAERFERGGRYPLQARCVHLARMGCVVFHYDMVGYADSCQLPHRHALRPEMNTAENWGFLSPQAELRLQSMMGLQTYNSVRVLDWFSGLGDVDPQRLGVTGASGGGTQTFILAAIDPRPAVVFPAVMVSTAMQGGCMCENASYLRVGTGNIEIAGLGAPRPLGMTAAHDWTEELATKGLPELKALYRLLGVEDRVHATSLVQFPHNYNYPSRAAMYAWMQKHLGIGKGEPPVEKDFVPLSVAEMSVWDAAHPRPSAGADYERSLLRWMTDDSRRQMDALLPHDRASLDRYRQVLGGAVDVLIGRRMPAAGSVVVKHEETRSKEPCQVRSVLLRTVAGEELPTVVCEPKKWNRQVVVWVTKEGKQAMFATDGQPCKSVARLLEAGMAVAGVDLLGQGEFTHDGKPWSKARTNAEKSGDWGKCAGYTYGYNHPLFSQRVHDILSVISYARHGLHAEKVHLAGLGGAGHWALAARAQAGDAVDRAAVDTGGFRFARLTAIDDPDFLPGGAKYLDLPGMAALSAPLPLWLAGEGARPGVVAAAYEAAGAGGKLKNYTGDAPGTEMAAIDWLLQAAP